MWASCSLSESGISFTDVIAGCGVLEESFTIQPAIQ